MSTPSQSPSKSTRGELVESLLQATEEIIDHEEDLQDAELDLAQAEVKYTQASQRLVTKLDHVESSMARLRATISPPGSPSRRARQAQAATPSTPTRNHTGLRFSSPGVSVTAPSHVPFVHGALYTAVKDEPDAKVEIEVKTPAARPTPKRKNGKLYVVFFGRDGQQGVFENWTEASELCDGCPFAIQRAFNSHDLGQKAFDNWNRHATSDVLMESTEEEKFVVVVGEVPGVYSRRGLAKIGLGWHGGKVARFEGSWEDARILFRQFQTNGEVTTLPSWGIS